MNIYMNISLNVEWERLSIINVLNAEKEKLKLFKDLLLWPNI